MSAGPRTKRQFAGAASDPAQRQITSFFTKTSSSPSSSAQPSNNNPTRTTGGGPLNGPSLPAHIQSNLLSVGMRVRKSVPEGYKTGSTYSGFSLWSEDMDSNSSHSGSDTRPVPAVPSLGVGGRELTPFCGIHKVGGLAVQANTQADYSYSTSGGGGGGLDSLPSSQESIMSNTSVTSAMAATSSAAMNRKRFYVTEEEEEEAAAASGKEENPLQQYTSGWFPEHNNHGGNRPPNNHIWRNRADWLDGEISPRSLAPTEWGDNNIINNVNNSRIMAVPKSRIGTPTKSNRNGGGVGGGLPLPPGASVPMEGQENMVVDDFEDATFLDYRIGGAGHGADMDLE